MKIVLTHLRGVYAGNTTEYEGNRLRIGRDPKECELVYDSTREPGVSRLHASILIEGHKVYVEDLKSRNGTFLEGVQVREKTPLPSGAVLQFGSEGPSVKIEYEVERLPLTQPAPVVDNITCSGCGSEYSEPLNFCRKCGSPISGEGLERSVSLEESVASASMEEITVCTGCGTRLTGQKRFCPSCGTALKRVAEIGVINPPTAAISVEEVREIVGARTPEPDLSPEPVTEVKPVPPRRSRRTSVSRKIPDTLRTTPDKPKARNESPRSARHRQVPPAQSPPLPPPLPEHIAPLPDEKPQDQATAIFQKAQAHALNGRFSLAVEECKRALELHPDYTNAYSLLGQCLIELKQVREAIAAFEKAVSLKPSADIYVVLGQVYLQQEQYEEAAIAAREAIRLNKSIPEAYYTIGQALMELGELDHAYDAFQHALGIRSDYADAHLGVASVEFRRGHPDPALAACRKAIKAQPKFPQAFCLIGQILRARGQYEDAYRAFQDALKLKPDYTAAFNYMALNFRSQKRLEEAEAACRKGLRVDPEMPELHNTLGLIQCDNSQYQEGSQSYEKAIALRPTYAEAHNNLGLCKFKTGDHEGAVGCFERAIELEPNFVLAHFNLAMAYYKLKDREKVRKEYEVLRRLDRSRAAKLYQKIKTLLEA